MNDHIANDHIFIYGRRLVDFRFLIGITVEIKILTKFIANNW